MNLRSSSPMRRLSAAVAAMLIVASSAVLPAASAAQAVRSVPTGPEAQVVSLPRGSSMAIDLPADARDVVISNPAVAEALTHSPRRITIIGVAPGQTDAVFLDATGRTILSLKVRVDAGTYALQDTISRMAPGSDVHAEAVNDSIILTGTAATPGESARIAQIAGAFVSAPEKVLNMMSIAGSDQVTLKVRVVEIQRNAVKQLGFDTNAVFGQLGDAQFLLGQAATFGVNGGLLGGLSAGAQTDTTQQPVLLGPCSYDATQQCPYVIRGPGSLPNGASNYEAATPQDTIGSDDLNQGEAMIKAFERVGLIRTLAEPNLTSVNGEDASFLAGGEFPVPVGRDRDGQITVEYKKYGISLAFRPVVLSGGRISMQISVEVSDLSSDGALTIGAGTASSITLQGLAVRRVQNTVEMPSGGSMMIAGLLKETTRQQIDGLPGTTTGILGSLFRSRDYLSGETELVVIVEPYIVTPTSPARMQTPADGLRIATDLQTSFFGQLNQVYGTAAPTSAPGAGWQGPVGYVIE